MYHYLSRKVRAKKLDMLIAAIRETHDDDEPMPAMVVIEACSIDDDQEVDQQLAALFDRRDWDSEDQWRREHDLQAHALDAAELFLAASLCSLTLGTVLYAPGRSLWVVELDWEAAKNAAACAIVGTLPEWAITRAHALALQHPEDAPLGVMRG
ncbi:MAG TPA: hypothetical protein VKV21_03060 [Solirubrobacteraceae bacterium]|nr:hypothetical protein [Solirubrobacteraceae bacterium]